VNSTDTPLALLLGACTGLGLWLAVLGALRRPRAESPTLRETAARWRGHLPSALTARTAVMALGVGAGCWLVTGWPVAALLTGIAVVALPPLLGPDTAAKGAAARLEALAVWAEMLRDVLASAAGLQQAVLATADTAPVAIRPALQTLAARLRAGKPLPAALEELAAELDDPVADLMVVALATAARRQARDLGALLGRLAAATRQRVSMQLRIEASRARVRTSTRVITAVTLGVAAALAVLHREFLSAYDSLLGQLVLAAVGLLFAAGYAWLHQISKLKQPPRVLLRSHTTPEPALNLDYAPASREVSQ
jgi:Flp pilus assembly protein TadB